MAFKIEQAVLISLFVQSVTWGFFASLFAQSTSLILARQSKPETRRVNTRLLLVSILMFFFSTVFVSVSLYRYLHAFMSIGEADASVISAQLGDFGAATFSVQLTAFGSQTLLGDGFMVYRTYMVWGEYLPVCIPPILTLLVSLALGSIFMFTPSHSTKLGIAFFSLTLFTNGCCTALIAGRIVWLRRGIDNHYGFGGGRRSNFGPAVTVIVESGAIYSFSVAVVIALYPLYGLTEQNVAIRAVPQIMGIIFSFIIVRVASRLSSETTTSHSDSHVQHTAITDMFHSPQTDASYTFEADAPISGHVG